jgi:hypothetical protein
VWEPLSVCSSILFCALVVHHYSLYVPSSFCIFDKRRVVPVVRLSAANKNHLELRSNSPQWVYSYAPLVKPDGTPVDPPAAGAAGYAMALHDRQVRQGVR